MNRNYFKQRAAAFRLAREHAVHGKRAVYFVLRAIDSALTIVRIYAAGGR
jgi:hypothetical protein